MFVQERGISAKILVTYHAKQKTTEKSDYNKKDSTTGQAHAKNSASVEQSVVTRTCNVIPAKI